MAKLKCTKSVNQPTVRLIEKGKKTSPDITKPGYVSFKKDESYDLEKIVLHYDKKQNEAAIKSLKEACFKPASSQGGK